MATEPPPHPSRSWHYIAFGSGRGSARDEEKLEDEDSPRSDEGGRSDNESVE
jgi:hypothetical protein